MCVCVCVQEVFEGWGGGPSRGLRGSETCLAFLAFLLHHTHPLPPPACPYPVLLTLWSFLPLPHTTHLLSLCIYTLCLYFLVLHFHTFCYFHLSLVILPPQPHSSPWHIFLTMLLKPLHTYSSYKSISCFLPVLLSLTRALVSLVGGCYTLLSPFPRPLTHCIP